MYYLLILRLFVHDACKLEERGGALSVYAPNVASHKVPIFLYLVPNRAWRKHLWCTRAACLFEFDVLWPTRQRCWFKLCFAEIDQFWNRWQAPIFSCWNAALCYSVVSYHNSYNCRMFAHLVFNSFRIYEGAWQVREIKIKTFANMAELEETWLTADTVVNVTTRFKLV